MSAAIRVEELLQLDVEERLRLIELLWNSLAARPDQVAVTEAQREIIAQRLAEHEADPADVIDWDAVKGTIRLR